MTRDEILKKAIEAGRGIYGDESVEIDDNAMPSVGDPPLDGFWLQAWVWIPIDSLGEVSNEDLKQLYTIHRGSKCPHGNNLGDCSACDVAGDLAFDAAREDRYR